MEKMSPNAVLAGKQMFQLVRGSTQVTGGTLAVTLLGAKLLFFNILFAATGVVTAAFAGRVYCGWFCPMGAWLEHGASRFSRSKPAPAWMSNEWFGRIFSIVFVAGFASLFFLPVPRWIIPVAMMGTMVVIGTALAAAFYPRAYCAHVCPWGVMQAIIGRRARLQIVVDEKCRGCLACSRACPLDKLPAPAVAKVRDTGEKSAVSSRCIRCMKCTAVCPANAIRFRPLAEQTVSPLVQSA